MTTTSRRGTGRKEIIVEAALELVIEQGVHATSHRDIARRAEVPLGSLTYYFDGLSDLFVHAFDLLLTRMTADFHHDLRQAADLDEAIDVLTDVICGARYPGDDILTGLVELYAYANHNAAALEISRSWLVKSRETLLLHFPEHTIPAIDALHEGWLLHQQFTGGRAPRQLVHGAIRALADQRPHGRERLSGQ